MRCGAGRLAPSGRGSRPERGVGSTPSSQGEAPSASLLGCFATARRPVPALVRGSANSRPILAHSGRPGITQYPHAGRVSHGPGPMFAPSRDSGRGCESPVCPFRGCSHESPGIMCARPRARRPAASFGCSGDTLRARTRGRDGLPAVRRDSVRFACTVPHIVPAPSRCSCGMSFGRRTWTCVLVLFLEPPWLIGQDG